jgi:hypothetical protein
LYPRQVEGQFAPAFPKSVAERVAAASAEIPASDLDPAGDFVVSVEGELLRIPYRIYNAEPSTQAVRLNGESAHVLACLYTRHHDGHVRQRHLREIVELTQPWIAPYVVQLIGEYVVEILIDIRNRLTGLDTEGAPQRVQYGAFVAENPEYMDLIAQRMISYWNCYYRHEYPKLSDYPGHQLVLALKRAGNEHSADDRS